MPDHSKPTVGCIVHYHHPVAGSDPPRPGPPRAAIVTATQAEDPTLPDATTVHLTILAPMVDPYARHTVRFSPTPAPNCWSWPPRV